MNMDGKVIRRTWPTASFSLTVEQIAWIEAEAKRRGISKSVLIRTLIAEAQEREAA
jgi:hypothetical protein